MRFHGSARSFAIHGSLDGMLIVSYYTSLFAYVPCSGRYSTLPPIHMSAILLGLYLHPLEEGEYRILYRSNHKPYRYGYCVIGRDMDTWISRPATSEEVLQILENGKYDTVPATTSVPSWSTALARVWAIGPSSASVRCDNMSISVLEGATTRRQ